MSVRGLEIFALILYISYFKYNVLATEIIKSKIDTEVVYEKMKMTFQHEKAQSIC